MNVKVKHSESEHIFYAEVDGYRSRLAYKLDDQGKVLDFYSTFVPVELRGKQIGRALVKAGFNYAHENHFKVLPSCPFVRKIVNLYPKYESLIAK